ncbi:hypothetical protein [Nonomuraea sp. NPDC049725]|uniref:hypothetical protein n=1 Tax=Nonomuraea sp. NPDC049725 TaxID=3154508 RepID=UPI003431550E
MPNLLRAALTAAVLAAIAVRLRRRARLPRTDPPAPDALPAPRQRRRPGLGRSSALVAGTVAGTVAVLAALALLGTGLWPGQPAREASSPGGSPVRDAAPERAEPPAEFLTEPPEPHALPSRQGSAAPQPCDPGHPVVTVRPLDPQVKRAVNRQWRRIERWLSTNAPKTYAGLGRPGRARTIAVAEAQTGLEFPDDLRASLLRHDGARGFGFGGGVNLRVREIRDAWRARCARDAEGRHRGLVPFGLRPGRGGHALVTAARRDGAAGREGATGRAAAAGDRPSYYALMREVAAALETGAPVDGRRPVVKGGVLRWTRAR